MFRWWDDDLPECHFSDRIWGNAIRTAEFLYHHDSTPRDRVLHGLMAIGIQDWKAPTNKRNAINAEAMRHSSAMVARIVRRLYTLEDRVSPLGFPLMLVGLKMAF